MKWKERYTTIALFCLLIVGLGLLLYPPVSDFWNSFHQSRAMLTYAENVGNMKAEEFERILESARSYNRDLSAKGGLWEMNERERAEYNEELDVGLEGIMGYIKIPKIDVELPVYHGVDEKVLLTSIGHLEGTSLPVGLSESAETIPKDAGSHCVLSGHRGLPSATLFSDLDRMREGDIFTITVLNETLTYEVDQIRVVAPNDFTDLAIVNGQDYCTLLTCTPYMINSHRLLVRGHRTDNPDGNAMVIADALQIRPVYVAPFIAVPILVLLFIIFVPLRSADKASQKKDLGRRYLEERGIRQTVFGSDGLDGRVLEEFLENRRIGMAVSGKKKSER